MLRQTVSGLAVGFAVVVYTAAPVMAAPVSSLAGPAFDKMIVFGDSLSDTGNVFQLSGGFAPPSPPFFDGRFSNGPVWVEFLADDLGVTLETAPPPGTSSTGSVNFSLGGSQSGVQTPAPVPGGLPAPGALGQINQYLADFTVDSDALHILWTGANDYILPFLEPLTFPSGGGMVFEDPDAQRTVGRIVDGVTQLIAAGVQTILVPNLPDLGAIPLAGNLATALLQPTIPAELTAFTNQHNDQLDVALDQIEQANPGVAVIELDVFDLFEDFFVSFPISDQGVIENCLFDPTGQSCDPMGQTGAGFLFWDEQHPTTDAHQQIAVAAGLAIGLPAAVSEPGTMTALAAGLIALMVVGRRRLAHRRA